VGQNVARSGGWTSRPSGWHSCLVFWSSRCKFWEPAVPTGFSWFSLGPCLDGALYSATTAYNTLLVNDSAVRQHSLSYWQRYTYKCDTWGPPVVRRHSVWATALWQINSWLCDDKSGWMTQFPCRIVIVKLIIVELRLERSRPASVPLMHWAPDGCRTGRNARINYQFM
jgi:hypothetical protein